MQQLNYIEITRYLENENIEVYATETENNKYIGLINFKRGKVLYDTFEDAVLHTSYKIYNKITQSNLKPVRINRIENRT